SYKDVHLAQRFIFRRIVLAKMTSTTFLAFFGRAGDSLSHGQHVFQFQGGMPAWIISPVAGAGYCRTKFPELTDLFGRLQEIPAVPDNACQRLHSLLKFSLQLEWVLGGSGRPIKGRQRRRGHSFHMRVVNLWLVSVRRVPGGEFTGAFSEYEQI